MTDTNKHPLEPLTASEVQLAVSLLKEHGKVGPTTRFVSVSLKEPEKEAVHRFTPLTLPSPSGGEGRVTGGASLRRPFRQRRERLL